MKHTKKFKARRGIHFDRSIPQGPAASFLGAAIDVVTITGSVMRSVTGSEGVLYASDRSGSVDPSKLYRIQAFGLTSSSLGGLGRRAQSVVSTRTGSVPSWTNAHLGGGNRAYVSTALTSSDYELRAYNTFLSGTEPLESSPVPASASMYYGKNGKYKTVVVKKTASVLDTNRLPTGMDGFSPKRFVSGKGTDITSVTGSVSWYAPSISPNIGSSVLYPCVIPIDVPHQGKIVDIKVWLELQQTSGSTSLGSAGRYPLANLVIALRSPNVRGFHAHPIKNDPALKKVFTSDLLDFSAWGAFSTPGRSLFGPDYITPIWRDTFLLWEGPAVNGEGTPGPWDIDQETGGFVRGITNKYPCWQRDRGMRTVFSDGALIPNPRHLVNSSVSQNYNGAPNSYFGFNNALGFDVPWTSETEISGANTYQLAGSPPRGWLTGPGGTADVNEWPTTGVNYGADYIKPLYPLLDPVYQRKRFGDLPTYHSNGQAVFDPSKWTGYRPGLRGTEVSGTWYLILADHGGSQPLVGDLSGTYTPTYFRQVRLEFILESGSYTNLPRRGNSRVRARKTKNELLLVSVSGTDACYDMTGSWDAHVSDTYFVQDERGFNAEVGRTLGVGILTGSAEATSDFALLYRLTGTLADVSGSGPGWLMNNQFGMPWIPISSASLAPVDSTPIVGIHPQDALVIRPILDGARRLSDAARDALRPRTLAQQVIAAISGTAT